MNCKHVQELLPLYVGGDLEEKRATLVTAHVQSCEECAGSANEYRESQQLLQLYAPPPFSEAVYDGIRQRVLREIGREPTSPNVPQFIASLNGARIRWALASALLLVVSVFAFYFIANRNDDLRQLAGSRPSEDATTKDKQPDATSHGDESTVSPSPSSKENDGPRTGSSMGVHPRLAGSADHIHQSKRRKGPEAADLATSAAVNPPDKRSTTAEITPEPTNLAQPDALPSRNSATLEKTLRVEMQTKDPNIRIIWFSPQRTKQSSPSKSTKGNQEVRSYA